MKRTSTLKSYTPLKRGNGFKKVVGNSLKRSSFKRTPSKVRSEIISADSRFSKFIINRDKCCLYCSSTEMLTCSHFHGRANYATRFEPTNCVTFCLNCHTILESKKSTEYMDFMIDWLGEDQFFVLDKISKMKISKEDSLVIANNLLNKVEPTNEIQF